VPLCGFGGAHRTGAERVITNLTENVHLVTKNVHLAVDISVARADDANLT
jgi:hypothetical protein